MPATVRRKRTLAEADANPELAPAAKQALMHKGKGKVNRTNGNEVIAEAAASKEPIEVNGKATSQDESARNPKKGSTSAKEDIYPAVLELLLEMRDGMRQLLDHQTSSFQTKQSSNIQSKKTALQAKPGRQQSKAAGGKEWIYICFPQSEQRMQKKVQKRLNGDEDDEEESDESGKKSEDKKTRPIRDAMEAYPVSARTQQQEKRNPDIFDLIIFHDFAGYGNCEVIEDMFVAFDKEPRKKQKDPTAVCSVIESMASFLLQCDLGRWHMLGDSEGNAKCTMLLGTVLYEALVVNEKKTSATEGSL